MPSLVRAGALAAVTALLGGGGALLAQRDTPPVCPNGVRTLDVVTAPELAPVLSDVAAMLAQAPDGACRRTAVRGRDAARVAATLSDAPPAVWIPDSSAWFGPEVAPARARAAVSVARSPVTLVARPAAALGRGPRLRDVLSGPYAVRLSVPDPAKSAPSAAALVALRAATDRATLAAALRAARLGPGSDAEAEAFTGAGADAAVARLRAGTAVPVREQLGRRPGALPRGSVTVPLSGPVLDYPYLVLADGALGADADRLRAALTGPVGRTLLRERGFRLPARGGALTAAAMRSAADAFAAIRRGSRMLTVLDVSGSMGQPVAGARGATRMELTRAAALRGLRLFPDDARVGLWVFSTRLNGRADYRELVPVTPLARGRERVARALSGVRHVPGGNTGLYDTALAAVRTVRAGWDPQRVNSVVLISDGRNEDPDSIALGALIDALRREQGSRPVPVITIGLGADSDPAALAAISLATGGSTYVARTPEDIPRVFLDAVGRRPCRPSC